MTCHTSPILYISRRQGPCVQLCLLQCRLKSRACLPTRLPTFESLRKKVRLHVHRGVKKRQSCSRSSSTFSSIVHRHTLECLLALFYSRFREEWLCLCSLWVEKTDSKDFSTVHELPAFCARERDRQGHHTSARRGDKAHIRGQFLTDFGAPAK